MALTPNYGYCPECGAPGISRQRCLNGNDTCVAGHAYPSSDALKERPEAKKTIPYHAQDQVIEALKVAYKYACGDDEMAENDVIDTLVNALCESIGDDEFQAFCKTFGD